MRNFLCLMAMIGIMPGATALAQDTSITTDLPNFSASLSGITVEVTRSGPACPPACVEPIEAADGIVTVGELEVLGFLKQYAANGAGLLVDTRPQNAFARDTLPGAVSVPASTMQPDNPYRADLLAALGLEQGNRASNAYTLLLFDQNAASPEAAQAVRDLLQAGYPAEKILYYRAGFDGWTALGLSTQPGT